MTPILEAVLHETTHFAVSAFPSLRPCVPTEKRQARPVETLVADFFGHSVWRNRLFALAVTPRCTTRWQCAWLLSKEGEEQKEVLEAKDDEEKESELDGEVEERERESHSTCA